MKKISRKILIITLTITALSAMFNLFTPASTLAFDGRGTKNGPGPCEYPLGLTSWDCGVVINDENSLTTGIWQIVANVAVDITVIATYLIIGYVIYGGYLYMFSSGDPAKVAIGKKTLTQAFIGLAIIMSANVIMGAIRIALVGGSGNIGNCAIESSCIDPGKMVENLIKFVIAIGGIISAIFVVYGGISYMTSSGDPGKLKKAKDTILYSLIGLIIVALALVITNFVSGIIRDANKENNTSLVKSTIIAKEVSHYEKIH